MPTQLLNNLFFIQANQKFLALRLYYKYKNIPPKAQWLALIYPLLMKNEENELSEVSPMPNPQDHSISILAILLPIPIPPASPTADRVRYLCNRE